MHTELREAARKGDIAKRTTRSWQWLEGSADLDKAREIVSKYIKDREKHEEECEPTSAEPLEDSSCAIVSLI